VTTSATLPAPRTVTVDDRSARFRSTGPRDTGRPPVLLLHGIGRSLDDWDEQHRLLADDRYVVSVDLAGFGESDPLATRHTLTALAAWVGRFCDAVGLGDEPLDVVGNSLGGAVAMRLSTLRPGFVRRLALLDSAGFGETVTQALRLIALPVVGRILLRPTEKTAARTERALFRERTFVSRDRIDASLARGRRPGAMRAFREVAGDLGTMRGIRPEWRERLVSDVARAGTPVLVVWGEDDLILPSSHLEDARRLLPAAQTHLLAHTGHMPQIERAAEVSALLRAFLA
jgi:pimeloyl-ACP methyl ester carboxylesterase